MVFEPTFEEIGREDEALPDLADENDVEPLTGDEPEEDLPPEGA